MDFVKKEKVYYHITTMKVKDFRDQINKGLGSIILFLKENQEKSHKYYKSILYACTHATGYDPQCDNDRSQYLWELMKLSGYYFELQNDVLKCLFTADDWDILQIYRIAKLIAINDNLQALILMKKAFKFNESWNCFVGAEEIIEAEGIHGLIFVEEIIGKKLLTDEEYCEDDTILEFAYDHLGKDNVLASLNKFAKCNSNIKAYMNCVNKLIAEREEYQNNREKLSYKKVKKIINGEIDIHKSVLMGWAMSASDNDLLKISNDFLTETDKEKFTAYLRIFWRRKFPLNYEKILKLAKSSNSELSYSAIRALRNICGKEIHDLAAQIILKNQNIYDVLDLFVNNYMNDDYIIFEKILFRRHNKHSFHSIAWSLLNIYEGNSTPNCLNIMIEIYKNGECSTCRETCIKILMKNHIIPDWILAEVEYDCNLDIRKLANEYKNNIYPFA